MLFGSHSIYEHLLQLGSTCSLVTFQGKGHEVAPELFDHNQETIVAFIVRVLEGSKFQEQHFIR